MSIILRLKALNIPNPTLITMATAVLVCRVIQYVTEKKTKIKWVNDILLDNKKICGILTEAVTDFESGNIDWIVVGIGININTTFSGELNGIAASILENETDGSFRNRVAAEIINKYLLSNDWVTNKDVYAEYKNRMDLLGKKITVVQMNETYEAVAIDINEHGHLIVMKNDKSLKTLSSGEVSIKIPSNVL